MRILLFTSFALALSGGAAGRELVPPGPEVLYAATSPAVVGIDSWIGSPQDGDSSAYGTGFIVDPGGLVVTSITVAPPEAKKIRAYLRGGHTVELERVRSVPEMELVLLRLRPSPRPYPFLRLGDSSRLRVGQLAYTLGNAFHSISEDDQVSFAAGAVSGGYTLTEARNESRYIGPAIETTAAINDGMDGGPLVSARGEVVGLISLNFSKSRWLGTAIPVNGLKPILAKEIDGFSDREEQLRVFLGLELRAPLPPPAAAGVPAEHGLLITAVDPQGPAEKAGLEKGQRIVSLEGKPLSSARQLKERLAGARPGDRLKLEIERDGSRRDLEVTLWGRY